MTASTCARCGAPLGDLGGGRRRGSVMTDDGPACTFPASCEARLTREGNPVFRVAGKPKGSPRKKAS